MHRPYKSILTLASALLVGAAISTSGCDDDDTPSEEAAERRLETEAEEAGDKLGEAGRAVGDTLEAAGDRIAPTLERGKQSAGEALENAGRSLQRDADPPPTTRPSDVD